MGLAIKFTCPCGRPAKAADVFCATCFKKYGADVQEAHFAKRRDFWIRKKWRKDNDRRI